MSGHYSRRAFLTVASTACGVALAGCSSGTSDEETPSSGASAAETDGQTTTPTDSSATPTETAGGGFGGSLDDVANYDGTVTDRTGQNEVRVTVGAEGNGGAFAFAPAAVRVSQGTTVVWEWTGDGGSHNVVAESGADFESELTTEQGFTFEYTFENVGTVTYVCEPHETLRMRGGVVVE
jgi:halocyanin-like protein